MVSRSLPMTSVRTRKQALARVTRRTPAVQTVIAGSVALLILFLWMLLMLAMQIESTGRQIQVKTEELERTERANALLRREIAEAGSQEILSARAQDLDYQFETPLYLLLNESLAPTASTQPHEGKHLPATASGGDSPSLAATSFLDTVVQTFDIAVATDPEP